MTARLLHLIDAVHPAAPPTLAALIAAWPEAEHRVLVRGSWAMADALRSAGLPHVRRTTLLSLRQSDDADADRILAWSARAATAAAIARPRTPLTWIAFQPPGRWTAALLRRRDATALCFSNALREQLTAAGQKAQCVPPLFDPRWLSQAEPDRWQRQSKDRLIALLADDPRQCDVQTAVLAISLLQESLNDQKDPPRLRLLAHPEAIHQARARRLIDDAEAPARLLVDPQMSKPWQLLASCDLALLWGENTTLAATWATAAGLPTLAAAGQNYRLAAENLRPLVNMGKTPISQIPLTSADSAAWRAALMGT